MNSRDLRIAHHLSITSLIEKTEYIKENDTWIEQSVEDLSSSDIKYIIIEYGI